MSDQEFRKFIEQIIDSSISKCNKQIQEQELEECQKCLQNVGLNGNREVICIRDMSKLR